MALNEEINRNLAEEDNVKNAYNAFRTKRGLAPIDFSVPNQSGLGGGLNNQR